MMGLNSCIIYIRLAAKCMVIGYLQLNSMRLGKMAIHYVKECEKDYDLKQDASEPASSVNDRYLY